MHCIGFLKKLLSSDEKREVLDIIEHYRQGNLPLIVPVTLLNHYVRKSDPPYLRGQAPSEAASNRVAASKSCLMVL